MKHSAQYERALGNLFIMMSPIAPLFASECWSKFASVPNRIEVTEKHLKWSADVLEQRWPDIDKEFKDIMVIKVKRIISISNQRNLNRKKDPL